MVISPNVVEFGRKFVGFLAIGGFIASCFAYVESFKGLPMETVDSWPFDLHLGMFLFLFPIFWIERAGLRDRTYFWKGFEKARPSWVIPVIKILGIASMLQFGLFLLLSHGASPAIIKGHYVLNSHGTTQKVISKSEYLTLKGSELRMFVSAWMMGYFTAAAYWWFPRREMESDYL